MSKRAFDKIADGLTEAIAVTRGEAEPARLFIPAEIDIRAIRQKMAMSQDEFASAFGFSLNQIRDWEQSRSRPIEALRAYLTLIEANPAGILAALRGQAGKRKPRKVA